MLETWRSSTEHKWKTDKLGYLLHWWDAEYATVCYIPTLSRGHEMPPVGRRRQHRQPHKLHDGYRLYYHQGWTWDLSWHKGPVQRQLRRKIGRGGGEWRQWRISRTNRGLSLSPFSSHTTPHTCLSIVWTEHPQKISIITDEDEGDFVDWCPL